MFGAGPVWEWAPRPGTQSVAQYLNVW
jgi:hypothetical protein